MAEFDNEPHAHGAFSGHIGKFPVWAIGLALAGGVVLIMILRSHFSKGASSATAAGTGADMSGTAGAYYTDPTVGSADYPAGPINSYLANDPTNSAYPVGLVPQGVPGPVTNAQWARLAADQLIAKGDDPTLVNNALNGFINGSALDAQSQAVVNAALQMFGEPPEGVLPITIVTGTNGGSGSGGTSGSGTGSGGGSMTPPIILGGGSGQAPVGSPATQRRYVIVAKYTTVNPPWNSTLSGIAAHYGTSVAALAAINHISNPNLIITGQKIWIDPA